MVMNAGERGLSRSNLTDTWCFLFFLQYVRRLRTFSDGSIAEGLRRELSQVGQMEDDRE